MTTSTDVLGRRALAAIVDMVALVILFVVLSALLGTFETGDESVSIGLNGVWFVLYVLLSFGFYGVPEATSGRTLGKALLGLRVVDEDGETQPSGRKVLVRTLLRVIDGVAFYAVALAVALATGDRRQRIGDLAAGTFVVADRR